MEGRVSNLEEQVLKLRDRLDGLAAVESVDLDARLATADFLFEQGDWALAGEGYLALLDALPEHSDAERILERALEAFEWEDRPEQVELQENLLEWFPHRRGPGESFRLAALLGLHGDAREAIDIGERALRRMPENAERLYALHEMAGFYCRLDDAKQELVFLAAAHALASRLDDVRTQRELGRILETRR